MNEARGAMSEGLPLTIDGSQGEGGGQMLRTSLSLAAVLGRPVRIVNVRAGRPKPGLAPQHLTSCRAVAQVCGGELSGDELRSQTIELHPGGLAGGEFVFDVADITSSAGSVGLIFQAILPPLLYAREASHVILRGGTEVPWSPVFAYLQEVFRPVVERMGANVRLQRNRAGWYPAGGGEVEAWIEPVRGALRAVEMVARGEVRGLACYSTVSERLPRHIARRQCEGVANELRGLTRVESHEEQPRSGGPGTACVAVARFARGAGGFTALGERGKKAEDVGAEAGRQLREFLQTQATVDERLADQLQLYAALAEGRTTVLTTRLTGHVQTNADVIRQLTDVSFEFADTPTGTRVSAQGIGLQPQRI
jgi:RNA 3'-terminal phosphate cyclase (ATP)